MQQAIHQRLSTVKELAHQMREQMEHPLDVNGLWDLRDNAELMVQHCRLLTALARREMKRGGIAHG